MESLTVRHLPFWIAEGPQQMAADEVMLESAAQGRAGFRLYTWTEPTVSLGYFQSHQVFSLVPRLQPGNQGVTNLDPRLEPGIGGLAGLPLVRRSTGGMTLVHHYELTYSLALPANYARQPPVWWLEKIHRIIRDLLFESGVAATLASEAFALDESDFLCFRHITSGDLVIGQSKIVGSAQRRHRGALLQHGAILLRTSPFTPMLPGIEQLTGKTLTIRELCQAFPPHLGNAMRWSMPMEEWSKKETELIEKLVVEKYASPEWNQRR